MATARVMIYGPETSSEDLESADLPIVQRRFDLECASGDRLCGTWRGVPMSAFIVRRGAPDESTHLLIESSDGYRLCVALKDVLTGLLAIHRVDSSASTDAFPRLLAERLGATRAVKGITSIEAVELPPAIDPRSIDTLPPSQEAATE